MTCRLQQAGCLREARAFERIGLCTVMKLRETSPPGSTPLSVRSSNSKQSSTPALWGDSGSRWAWLFFQGSKLVVDSTPNQDNPFMSGGKPVMGLDVWEHAYYLKYQNRRPDYIEAWWKVVNWDAIAENFAAARK